MELSDRTKYETTVAAKVYRASLKLRREFERIAGDPPDISRVSSSFWQKVEDEIKDEIAEVLVVIWMASAASHGFQGQLQQARAFASLRSRDMAAGFSQHTRVRLTAPAASAAELGQRVESVFGPDRAEMVGITETSAAQTAGGQAWRDDIRSRGGQVEAYWRHSNRRPRGHAGAIRQPCPVCTPIEGTSEKVWFRKFPAGPPAHPHCDCFLEYKVIVEPSNERQPQP